MQEKITESTASAPLGLPPGRKLLKVSSGQYAGRLIALMQTGPAQLSFAYADRPYASWSAPVTITSDAADRPFDGAMDANGHVFVVYTQQSTGYLLSRRLNFAGGVWSVLAAVTVVASEARQPSIVIDTENNLRVAWTAVAGSIHTLRTKVSTDAGATWGSGPSDTGEALTSGASSVFAKLLCDSLNVHAIYTDGGLLLAHRSLPLSSGTWGGENTLGSGLSLEEEFDAAVASDGRLAVVWNDGVLKYREYDGALWGAVITLDSGSGQSPQLVFADTVPVAIYLSELAAGQNRLMYTTRRTGTFSTPEVLDRRGRTFDSVVIYAAASAAFADVTTAAADAVTADLFHPATAVLVKDVGDALYLGLDQPFRFLTVLLSTVGVGGTASFSYWTGTAWQAFVPDGGAYALDALDTGIVLWGDANDIPADWQKKLVNGASRFWVKIEVVSAFSTAPVGSRVTSVSDWQSAIIRR